MLVIMFLCIDALLFVCQLYTYSICISIGIVLSAGLQFPCIYKKIMKKITRMTKRMKKMSFGANGVETMTGIKIIRSVIDFTEQLHKSSLPNTEWRNLIW